MRWIDGEGLSGNTDAFGHGQVRGPRVGDLSDGLTQDVDACGGKFAVGSDVKGDVIRAYDAGAGTQRDHARG